MALQDFKVPIAVDGLSVSIYCKYPFTRRLLVLPESGKW